MTMPQMTSPIDYKALAERVAQRAIYADNNADQNNKTWAADLRAIVSLLKGMADAQPVAWRYWLAGDGEQDWGITTHREGCENAVRVEPLYTHPAPAAPQAEPKREPLMALLELAEQSDDCQYGTLSTSIVRKLVNEALGIGGGND